MSENAKWLREEAECALSDGCAVAAGRLNAAADEIEQLRPVFQSIKAWAEHGIRRTTPGITQDQFHYIKHACDQALQTKVCEHIFVDGQQEGKRGRWCLHCNEPETLTGKG